MNKKVLDTVQEDSPQNYTHEILALGTKVQCTNVHFPLDIHSPSPL